MAPKPSASNRSFDLDRFFSLATDYLLTFELGGVITRANRAVCVATGLSADELIGARMLTLIHPEDLEQGGAAALRARQDGESSWSGRVRHVSGGWHWVDVTLVHDSLEDSLVLIGRDISRERRLTESLTQRAETDRLTGLANRDRLLDHLESAIAGGSPAVLFCDLDRFKVVNDSLGHWAGDELLRILGQRMRNVALGHPGIIGRIGGDEFVVVLDNAAEEEAITVAEQLRSLVTDPFVLRNNRMFVDMSVGISLCPAPGITSPQQLLGAADTAAYQAKALGRGRVVVFDQALQENADRRFNGEVQLRSALDENRIIPFYQPVIALTTGKIIGAEALVRLQLPDDSMLPPSDFLPVAEEVGLLPAIDRRMLGRAMAAFRHLPAPFQLGVNASPAQLVDPTFADQVAMAAAEASFNLANLMIEVTELSVLTDVETTTANLARVREWGAKVALDDFGTGYSSLSHLRSLPIDTIKIDRSFTSSMLEDRATHALVEAVVSLCGVMELGVVAEGVETEEQAAALRDLGCESAQGFLFYRPMPLAEFTPLLAGQGSTKRRRLSSAS